MADEAKLVSRNNLCQWHPEGGNAAPQLLLLLPLVTRALLHWHLRFPCMMIAPVIVNGAMATAGRMLRWPFCTTLDLSLL